MEMVTYKSLFDMMNEVRRTPYRSDPERVEATIAAVNYCLSSLLEKLAESEQQQLNAQAQAITQAQ